MILRYICPKDLIRILVKKDQRTESANILPSLVDCRVSSQEEAIKQKDVLATEVSSLRGELQQVRDERDRQLSQVQTLSYELEKVKESRKHSSTELDSLTLKANDMEEKCSFKDNQIKALEEQLATAEKKLQVSNISAYETRTEYKGQQKFVNELQRRLADAEYKLIEEERLRKKLHNTILELKGNIRVFCRVRPLLADESCSTEGKIFSYPTSMETSGRAIDLAQNGQKHSFTFDKVFTPEASQEEVFVEISQLVQSALDGYKVCIFAYGQTWSGKTYTMMGRPGHPEEKGLIPRSLEQIFQTKQSQQPQGWKYEIIADKVFLAKFTVSDLTVVDVHSAKEVAFLLNQPANSR
ncbi:Kinesin-like protein KIN-14C [Glycine soja]|uniref:Kinesin-like protein KIN-14C n=2 Tax=Glycine subgen. Soja TaxID=1462606 RepID=A0A445IKD6_GLYSO|nr:Kinesin-like protein KIN-14C [Glycine soja]